MKYNLATPAEVAAAYAYLSELAGKKSIASITKVSPQRSLRQNNYLHLLLGAFGAHFGYTLEEAKTIYKELNADMYEYHKTTAKGRDWTFYRSSADLSKDEMTKSIDVLREWSAKAGYPLPLATDQEWLRQISNEIERSSYYL